MQTDRMRTFPLAVEPLRMLPLVLTSLFVVVAAVDVLLVAQPALILSLRNGWQHTFSGGGVPTTWGSLLAAGVAVAGIAVAAAVLSTFLRAVQSAPYTILAPVLIGGCTLVAGRMQVSLPLPVSTPLFAGIGTLLLIGGGNLFRRGGFLSSCAGALLVVAPLALLASAYFTLQGSAAAALHPFDRSARLFTFVMGFASLGAPLLAIACRRPRNAAWADDGDDLGGQIVELLDRAQASEERAARAERELARSGRGTLRLATDDDALAMMRPGSGGWLRWASWVCCAAFLMGAYFAGYAPLQKRLNTQVTLNKVQVEQQAQALTVLRTRFERERRELEQQLAAATHGAPPAAAAPEAAAPGVLAPAPKLASPAPKLAPAAKPNAEIPTAIEPAKAAPGQTVRAARVLAKRRAVADDAKPNQAGKSTQDAAERAAPAAPVAKPARPAPVGVSRGNDPLEGLDGM